MKQQHTTDLITDRQSVLINSDEEFRRYKLCESELRACREAILPG